MKYLLISILQMILASILGVFSVKVIMSVSTLYNLDFIVNLGFIKLYGLVALVGLLFYKYKKDEKTTNEEKSKKTWIELGTRLAVNLIFWGLSFLMYYTLTY